MQKKTNDNEIVQYLRVKHIINYLEVQAGLTQHSAALNISVT